MLNRRSARLQKPNDDSKNTVLIAPTPREMLAACVGSSLSVAILAAGTGQWYDAGFGALATVITIFFFLTLPRSR
jgi:hypothetical protein